MALNKFFPYLFVPWSLPQLTSAKEILWSWAILSSKRAGEVDTKLSVVGKIRQLLLQSSRVITCQLRAASRQKIQWTGSRILIFSNLTYFALKKEHKIELDSNPRPWASLEYHEIGALDRSTTTPRLLTLFIQNNQLLESAPVCHFWFCPMHFYASNVNTIGWSKKTCRQSFS